MPVEIPADSRSTVKISAYHRRIVRFARQPTSEHLDGDIKLVIDAIDFDTELAIDVANKRLDPFRFLFQKEPLSNNLVAYRFTFVVIHVDIHITFPLRHIQFISM